MLHTLAVAPAATNSVAMASALKAYNAPLNLTSWPSGTDILGSGGTGLSVVRPREGA
jgi:hypothetical protein